MLHRAVRAYCILTCRANCVNCAIVRVFQQEGQPQFVLILSLIRIESSPMVYLAFGPSSLSHLRNYTTVNITITFLLKITISKKTTVAINRSKSAFCCINYNLRHQKKCLQLFPSHLKKISYPKRP